MLQHRRKRSTGRSGQSLAEFALVFPVLFLVIAGIIQFGIIFWGQNTLNQVVRDTGRWAASQQVACVTGPQQTAAAPAVIATANAIAASSSMIGYTAGSWTPSNVTVTWSGDPCPPNSNQQTAWVNITISANVPIFFPFVPGNGQLSSSTQFRMEPVPK